MLQFLFIVGLISLLYSYLLYPLLLKYLLQKSAAQETYTTTSTLPALSIIIAAHNEEKVLREKLDSILQSAYPQELIEILIGIDASSDLSALIAEEYKSQFASCQVFDFKARQGKIKIVNALVPKAQHPLIVLTDANVLFTENTLLHLQAPFIDPKIGLVDTTMKHYGLKNTGISVPESAYIAGEVLIKEAEGKLWGAMMGPFGGCFAFRKQCFEPIPEHFLVDDFYINMICIEKGLRSVTQTEAIVLEDVSNDLTIEFKRKIRISSGNFQNLRRFWPLLFKFNWVSFTFFSHKVLRWILPVFLAAMTLQIIQKHEQSLFDELLYFGLLLIPIAFVVDYLSRKRGVHLVWLRFVIHFVSMNLALLIGLFRFFGGIRSSVWQPTKRHQ
ncbi:MAG: glycosyltransferase [Crocinitomicaceae bacterium]|jgi:cellulose synthase/poly-beta-1,6-N-acetylglucosamine synthase-like glycosyltransferase|nr:glycosyltransferase [Crocinitomicaceae bacterium]MDP4724300.1 glycosyltransferase [Crocinitomicaceae bacterium]MDP4738630.1 glycosyltransferase [Crocinitomicaceae bacterium]MDP4798642.1 glycosyltransferase [Crocinitomicaceae bacterium]MDP4806089.1 glycosyltransferase [Crocinitomicaceae bacterium]